MFRNGYEKYWIEVRRGKGGEEREDEMKRTIRNARKSSEEQDGGVEGGDGTSDEQRGRDQGSSRRGSNAGRHRRRVPNRRASGSDDGEEGEGAAGSDRGGGEEVRVRRTDESREYEKDAYARWFKAYMERENKVSEKYQIIMGKPDKGVTDQDVQNFTSCVNDMSIVMKNISEEYTAIFFSSLPGGIEDYYIRKYLYDGIMNHMRMYVLKKDVMQKIVDETARLYKEKLNAPKSPSQEAEVSPVPGPVPPSSPGYARSTRISPPPPSNRSRREGVERFREGGRRVVREAWDMIKRANPVSRRGARQSPDAEASAGATPHTPRIRARAARRLEKMGYYKAEGSFLATPFSLDVLPVLESATSVHGGQPAAQVAAEQQAEGHRRVPVPPVGAGDL
jgi:hypothetical protein